LHTRTLDELRDLCALAPQFAGSRTRDFLMRRLSSLLRQLDDLRIAGDLWIGGSLLTTKLDPKDLDVCLRIQAALYDHGSPAQVACLDWLTSEELHVSDKIDGYLLIEYPHTDQNYALGQENLRYWTKQFGHDRRGVAQGIAVVQLQWRNA
jgi:hypothetical protein